MLSHRFRWVFCQLEVLRHSFPANLRRTLKQLPKSLDETYKRILNEINNANQEHAYRLLQCLTVASRPLRLEELAEVLAFDLTTGEIPKLNADWRWEDQEEAVLSACSSLVSVIVDIDDGSRIVQFSHFSVKEFLTSNRLESCKEEVSHFHIPVEPSHAILAQACLGVLLCLDDHTDEDSVKNIPLYQYTAEFWVGHTQVGNVELQIKDAIDYFFDMDNPHFSAWARRERPYDLLRVSEDEKPTGVPHSAAPLYFAARSGFCGLVERLIIKYPQYVNQLGGCHGTAMHASVLGGHIDISQLLFTHGANISSRCADNYTPLHIASARSNLKTGKWLLNHGADVNSPGPSGSTPLHLAAKNGHLEFCRILLRILLDCKAEVNLRDDYECIPIHLASYNGHSEVLQFLLDHNADMHVHDGDGDTALHSAALNGHLEVSRMLLELHVEVNPRNNEGSTPLHLASAGRREGSASVVRLLLDHGADVQARNLSGKTASEIARGPEQQDIIRLLSRHAAERTNETGYSISV